ncbi:Tis1421-transposase orfa protein [Streptomyces venezuelae]|nr:Tis1421-transposase orfa protein [Streptomyces venezuelae]CUM36925.1 hypothetical protein BN2537_2815 [Streptomyces venezuelae]
MGSKHHLITDATGIPLAATLTGGNPQRRHPADPAPPGRAARARPAWPTSTPA